MTFTGTYTESEGWQYRKVSAWHDIYGDESEEGDEGAGDDVLIGGAGYNYLDGGAGDDRIVGGSVFNEYSYSEHYTEEFSGRFEDESFTLDIAAGYHDSYAWGETWAEQDIDGGAGDDLIRGGVGDNYATGDEGDDVIVGSSALNEYWDLESCRSFIEITGVTGDAPDLSGSGIEYFDFEEYSYREGWARSQLFGGEGDDVVIGGVGDNTLWGGTGDDVLIGGTVPEYETYFESYGYDYGDGDTDFYESFYEDLDGRQRLDGGEGDDILIGGFGYNSLYGGAGEDLLVGGTEYTLEAGYDRGENYSYEWTDLYARQRLDGDGSMFGEGGYDDYTGVNDSIDAAQAVARSAFGIAPSADVGDDSLPRVEITGNIDGSGDWDFYAIEVQEGEELTLDIDYGRDQGVSVDMYLYLYDANGNEVARNDDASTSLGGGGSVHGYYSFIQTGGLAAGIYYVGARAYSTSYNAGDYVLNVSIEPTEDSDGFGDVPQTIADIDSEFAPLVSHDDVLIGGVGHNTIYGGQGYDFIVGSSGLNEYTWTDSWSEGEGTTTDEGFDAWANNSLYGGSGNDVIVGGMGDNYAEGGSGNDVISGSTAFEEEYGTYTSGDGSYHEEWHDLESHNRLYGDSGDDVITGGVGDYHIYGGSGGMSRALLKS